MPADVPDPQQAGKRPPAAPVSSYLQTKFAWSSMLPEPL